MTVQQRVLIHLVEQRKANKGVVLEDVVGAVHATVSEVAHALGALQLRGYAASNQRVYRITDEGLAAAPHFAALVAEEKRRPVGLLRQSERGDHSDAHSDVAMSQG